MCLKNVPETDNLKQYFPECMSSNINSVGVNVSWKDGVI